MEEDEEEEEEDERRGRQGKRWKREIKRESALANGAGAKGRREAEGKGRAAVHRCVWEGVRRKGRVSPWKFTGARVTGNLAVAARS